MRLVFIGDSDIAKWQPELLPSCPDDKEPPMVSGHSGATLDEIVPHVRATMEGCNDEDAILVACAGENDIGNASYALDETMVSFRALVDSFFITGEAGTKRFLVFLGPKLEPWLEDDANSRKQYVKLSKAMNRACNQHERSDCIIFVDCLTMFCGESGQVPGAVLGGKARAETRYFSNDRLHLGQEGYMVWKKVVGDFIEQIRERIHG